MAYSGGKDSTYTLRLLIENYQLKVLAITFNHGFISPTAIENINKVTKHLHVDHEYVSPQTDTIKEVFVKSLFPNFYPLSALKRASAVCISCMNLIKSYLIKKAIEAKAPLVVYGPEITFYIDNRLYQVKIAVK
ncbi:MAG: hypothetical protein A2V65_01700 [Deltaproteobacteria bacterium RBG_13_49_15]|nr:MAG: hypothetical protein A2V65_01700 [Deltaproteobacteria bacterium RBG_13_49_15]